MPDFLQLIVTPPDGSLLYAGRYDPLLVVLSVSIAICAAFAALMVAQQVAVGKAAGNRTATRVWTLVGGLCMGAGIWAMHFTGMLAFSLPCTTTYDPTITLLSMIPGVLASTLAVDIVSRPLVSRRQLLIGGLLLGVGIGTMHYSGMAAYRLNGLIRYDLTLFALSILVAVALATLALWIKFALQSWRGAANLLAPIVSAVVMGMAVSGMHYTAMAAAYFIRQGDATVVDPWLTPTFLAAVVLAITSVIIVVTLVASFLARPSALPVARNLRLVAVLLLGWSAAAWLAAGYYIDSLEARQYEQDTRLANQQAEDIAGNIEEALLALSGLPRALSTHGDLKAALARFGPDAQPARMEYAQRKEAWTADPALAAISGSLAQVASSLRADVIWLLNSAGDCVAASNAGDAKSFVGTNYGDRQYFRQTRDGQPGRQYAVGRVTKIPGLFYAYPIHDQGRFVGALAVKRDLATFAHWIHPARAFISDDHGVIILSDNKQFDARTMPNATVDRLSEVERGLRYVRNNFEPLRLAPWQADHLPNVLRLGDWPEPVVLASRAMLGHDLTVHVPHPVPELARLEAERFWVFLLMAIAGDMLILAVAAALMYVFAIRQAQRAASGNARLLEEQVTARTAELFEANRQLSEARDQAEAATRAKSAFLASMSHEIRTPMNAILGMAHLMRRDGVTLAQADRLEKIDTAGQHLLNVINAILDFSKIEAGKLTLEEAPVVIGAIAANVASILFERAQAKNLALLVETEPMRQPLLGDAGRLTQALLNFAANAVKFTEHGTVTLRTRQTQETEDSVTVRFEVEDTGIGIAAAALEQVFSAFAQAELSTSRQYGGTGLGLAIARRLARLMGGEAGASSVPGVGSTFWFTATLKKAPHRIEDDGLGQSAEEPAEAILARDHRGTHILLAEDDPINREVAVALLVDVGLSVDVAEDGRQAVELARHQAYAAILMDMQMPRMDGIEATGAIRGLPDGRHIPILAMTANAFAEDKARCLAAGMDDFIAKPIDPDVLFAMILKWLTKERQ